MASAAYDLDLVKLDDDETLREDLFVIDTKRNALTNLALIRLRNPIGETPERSHFEV
ncbi:hypothetical protein HYC85_006511 [Camellia sinensis]|uniref:Uncharacterized protein n=1 Tax=Camellia sinensis TaxID=4442 RepID=A0A7J7HM60_CAMSI|nr:hypothetical protein HYC85_006511 [Camellia sinensis]